MRASRRVVSVLLPFMTFATAGCTTDRPTAAPARAAADSPPASNPRLPGAPPVRTAVRPCRAGDLRAGKAFWVSPFTAVDMTAVLLRNVSSRACKVSGAPRAIASQAGLPNVPARGVGVYGTDGPSPPRVLAPRAAVAVVLIGFHDCAPEPRHRYHEVTLYVGGGSLKVALPATPDEASSGDRRVSLAVSPSCPPAVSGYLPPGGFGG